MIELEFVIPFYGENRYLLAAISRIQSLLEVDWKLTVVDDASPGGDETAAAVEALRDPRIRYLRNETNLGVNANIYRCIQLMERDLVVLTGYDDMVLPNYGQAVERLLHLHPRAAVVQPGVRTIDEAGLGVDTLADRVKRLVRPGGETVLEGERAVTSLLRGNWLYTPSLCYRREPLQAASFRPGIDAAHDLAFIVDALIAGGDLVVGSEVAFEYRRHRSSFSSSLARSGRRFEEEQRYFDQIEIELRQRRWTRAARAASFHPLSRLNALSTVPTALKARDWRAVGTLVRHGLG